MSEKSLLVVKSEVREQVKAAGLRVGDGFLEALSARVAAVVTEAGAKCTTAGRKTLRPEDL